MSYRFCDCLLASRQIKYIWDIVHLVSFTMENLMHMHCSLKSVIFWSNKTALDTTHGHTSQQRIPQLRNQQQTATRVLLHRHKDDEFCTNYSGCGRQGVTGDSLTLQRKDPSADQYGSLPMVVEKCPSEQILWDIRSHWNLCILYAVPPKLNTVHHK